MTATRSLMLSVKKGSRSMKTLDGQIAVRNDQGSRSAVSAKCAELDVQLPLSLGVSKSVLDNVIFCHQEDSSWPLSEPASLKRKFDEIFDAMRYAKAIDKIKTMRKEQLTTIKIDEAMLKSMKADKDRASKIDQQCIELDNKNFECQKGIAKLDTQIQEVAEQTDRLFSYGQQFERTLAGLTNLTNQKQSCITAIEELRSTLEVLKESDDELQSLLCDSQSRFVEMQDAVRLEEAKRSTMETKLANARDLQSNTLTKEGRLQAEISAYERLISERNIIFKEIEDRYFKKISPGDEISTSCQELLYQLSHRVETTSSEYDAIRNINRDEESKLLAQLSCVNARMTNFDNEKAGVYKQVNALESEVRKLSEQSDSAASEEVQLLQIRASLDKLKIELELAKEAQNKATFSERLQDKEASIKALDALIEELNLKLLKNCSNSSIPIAEEAMAEELQIQQDSLNSLLNTYRKEYCSLVCNDFEGNEEVAVQAAIKDEEDVIRQNEAQYFECIEKSAGLSSKLEMVRETLQNGKLRKLEIEKKILEICDEISEFDQLETKLDSNSKTLFKKLQNLLFGEIYLRKALEHAKTAKSCQLCRRNFESDEACTVFNQMINLQMKPTPAKKHVLETSLKTTQEDLLIVRRLQTEFETLRILENDIPRLELEILNFSKAFDEITILSKKKLSLLEGSKLQLKNLRNLNSVSRQISLYREQIKYRTECINKFSDQSSVGSAATAQNEPKEQLRMYKEKRCNLHRGLTSLMEEKILSDEKIFNLELKIRDVNIEALHIEYHLKEQKSLNVQSLEFKLEIEQLQKRLLEIASATSQAQSEASSLRDQLVKMQKTAKEEETAISAALVSLKDAHARFIKCMADIKRIEDDGVVGKLRDCRRQLKDYANTISKLETDIYVLSQHVADMNDKMSNFKFLERNINDNMRFRRLHNESHDLTLKIEVLEKKNAERDRRKYKEDSEKLKVDFGKLNAERAGILGEMKQIEDQLKKYRRELDTDYKDAEFNYRKQIIRVKTASVANEDLGKYGTALDSAIMKFHSIKMEEINQIIEELWKSTYSGTDVDTILIRSDNENTKGNRSYNYRGNVELDMRGRCSAGQKVLACIIIRLALAECFGVNFGVLALDEPTTNLDRENVQSLATSLSAIIKLRRAQKNFQLIVITHDEEFLQFMGCSDYCDYYYRISRDVRQSSIIERQLISEVL